MRQVENEKSIMTIKNNTRKLTKKTIKISGYKTRIEN